MRIPNRPCLIVIPFGLAALSDCPAAGAQGRNGPSLYPPPSPMSRPSANPNHRLNINIASVPALRSLPTVTNADVDRIVKGRPYSATVHFKERGILSPSTYAMIEDMITTGSLDSK